MKAGAPVHGLALRLGALLAALALLALFAPASRAQDADTRRKQEIILGELPARAVGDAPFDIGAKATSGLPVSLEIIAGPAVVDGKKVRLTDSPGLVIVRATQKGDGTYLPAVPAERLFNVRGRPVSPSFTLQPAATVASIGDTVTLSAEASGFPLPSYQWRKDGVDIAGATSRTLTISGVTAQDVASYEVVATNATGSAVSTRTRIVVGRHEQSINFPSLPAAVANQTLVLNASASSGLPVQYQLVTGLAVLSGNTIVAQQGTVIVQATQPGDSRYDPAPPVTQMIQVVLGPVGQRVP